MIDRSSSLLSTIQAALDANPPSISTAGTLRIHTLFSIPRQVKSLYPLAHIHPTDLAYNKRSTSISALEEHIFVTASWSADSSQASSNQASADPKDAARDQSAPLLILAIELYLYTIPESSAAVLYISKLDSSGYAPKAIPSLLREAVSAQVFGKQQGAKRFGNTLTAALSSAITQHFTTFKHWDGKGYPVSHLSVHILARSQTAYLFPSSPENKDKNVLSDGALIKWWRAVMSHVIVSTRDPNSSLRNSKHNERDADGEIDARAYYLIPGYNKLESHPLVPLIRQDSTATSASNSTNNLRTAQDILTEAKWTYGHPYSSSGASCSPSDLPPLPLHWKNSNFVLSRTKASAEKVQQDPNEQGYDPRKVRTVPTLMPHFSDDPKTRFLDEMARDAHEHSGWKKKPCSSSRGHDAEEGSTAPAVTKEEKENGIQDKVDISELSGENGSSSQANRADGVGGEKRIKRHAEEKAEKQEKKPKMDTTATSSGPSSSGVPLITIRALMREREAMDDVAIDEFWERMGFRQECCSGNAVGVLVILFTRIPRSFLSSSMDVGLERQPLSLPYKVLGDLVFKSLMKDTCEWNKVAQARTLTLAWWQGVDKEVRRKGGLQQYLDETGQGGQEGELVGKRVIWNDFPLVAPTNEQLERAHEGNKDENRDRAARGRSNGGGATAAANVLSVKRKKKPQA